MRHSRRKTPLNEPLDPIVEVGRPAAATGRDRGSDIHRQRAYLSAPAHRGAGLRGRDHLDPRTRITIGCRLEPTREESARLPRDEHPPGPEKTLFSDDYTTPEGDEYTISEA
jgi:hypothetical protein